MLKHLFFSVFFLFILSLTALSQDFGIDFENLKSEDLTNEQIIAMYSRAQAQGFTIQELESLALARGMAPAEVNKLRSRLLNIQSGDTELSGAIETSQDRLRENVDDTDISRLSTAPEEEAETEKSIFGSDLFNNQNLSFEPSLNIPTPVDYKLGPGDELIIDIWGAAENNYQLTISPEGKIQISNLGPIYLNGLTIEAATDLIRNRLSTIYSGLKGNRKDTFVQVTLGKIKTIRVNILGEVNLPGTYSISSLSTVFNALYVSGGPSENGTYREILVIRGNNTVQKVDLYSFLVYGDQSSNIRLQDQDIIKVGPYKNRVSLNGETKRKGLFETLDGETMKDLLAFSGGFNQQAYTKRIKIRRNTDTEKRLVEISYPEEANTVLESGDEILVGKILDRFANRVEIQGAVYREGEYQLEENPTLLTLINNADGLMGDAYMERAIIYRTNPDYTVRSIPVNLQSILDDPASKDIELNKDDIIRISSIFDLREERFITVSGQVNEGGTFPFIEDMTIKDLIFQAKGFTDEAAVYNIDVARRILDDASGKIRNQVAEVFTLSVNENLTLIDQNGEFRLEPFDQVFVRSSPSFQEQQTVSISGQVLYPGTYVIENRDFRISDLIKKAGGITEFAYPEGASLERDFNNLVDTLETEEPILSQVGIKLEEILDNPRSDIDLLLVPGDQLNIPVRMETVNIQGEVLFPINVRFDRGKNFKSYIGSAGGYSNNADKKKAYIVYANGEVGKVKKFLFFKKYPDVSPGSMIYIPEKIEKQRISTSERIAIYSTIVSMAAIVTNTIFQIRRN